MLALATPLFTMSVYDRVVPNGAIPSLIALSIGMGLAIAFDFLFRMVRSRMIDVTGKTVDVVLAANIFEHVMAVKMAQRPSFGRHHCQSTPRLRFGARVLYLRERGFGNRFDVCRALHRGSLYYRRAAGMDSAYHAANHDRDRFCPAASARSGDETIAGRIRSASRRSR